MLSFPVLLSLIAEPLTGLVDTAFVAGLGSTELAALGVGTAGLSSVFWIFNFLAIGTQTEVSRAYGRTQPEDATRITSLALTIGVGLGLALIVIFLPLAGAVSELLGAEGNVRDLAVDYINVRLFGAPAVLITMVGFGALRGLQDMRTPLIIAVSVNVANIALDGPLIYGLGPIPALGVGGAALASTLAQWAGAIWLLIILMAAHGYYDQLRPDRSRQAAQGRR